MFCFLLEKAQFCTAVSFLKKKTKQNRGGSSARSQDHTEFAFVLPWIVEMALFRSHVLFGFIWASSFCSHPYLQTVKLRTFKDVITHSNNVRHETAACPSSPVVDGPSALPSPTLLCLLQSVTPCLFTRCQTLYAGCCTVQLNISRYCTVRFKNFLHFYVLFV